MKSNFVLFSILGICAVAAFAEGPAYKIHGQAWTDYGQIAHSTDTMVVNLNNNRLQSMGAQFTALTDFGDNLEGALGFGSYQAYHSLGNQENERNTLSIFKNFLTEARLTWYKGERTAPSLSITVGNFAYNYHPQVKNLGLYLLRGPVYPGFLISGFKDYHVDTTRAAFTGLRFHHAIGNFQHDLILTQEHDLPPTYDWSVGYVAKYQAAKTLEIGAGVNFYHLIPEVSEVTSPNRKNLPTLYQEDSVTQNSGSAYHPYQLQYIEVKAPGDTVFYTSQGTKLMGMFNLDLKQLFGIETKGEQDLELYGEAAIIGVKNYGSVYNKMSERIPVTLGFNLPTFGWLDLFSVEAEYYGAKYRADYSKLGNFGSLYVRGINPSPPTNPTPLPSPIPVSYKDYENIDSAGNWTTPGGVINIKGTGMDVQNMTTDNLKWSLYLEKRILGHIRFIGQVANDHLLPRPIRKSGNAEGGGYSEAFTTSKDWYFMFRAGYFF